MNEKIEKLKASIEHDRDRIKVLQESITQKEKKLRQLELSEVMGKLNTIKTDRMDVLGIVEAIQNRDLEMLMTLMEGDADDERGNQSADKLGV